MGFLAETTAFEMAVNRLGNSVRKASVLWQDENYRQLSESVASLGNSSRMVVESGSRSRKAVEAFEKINSEIC